jgi:hypothetical protein
MLHTIVTVQEGHVELNAIKMGTTVKTNGKKIIGTIPSSGALSVTWGQPPTCTCTVTISNPRQKLTTSMEVRELVN